MRRFSAIVIILYNSAPVLVQGALVRQYYNGGLGIPLQDVVHILI